MRLTSQVLCRSFLFNVIQNDRILFLRRVGSVEENVGFPLQRFWDLLSLDVVDALLVVAQVVGVAHIDQFIDSHVDQS